jgi:hypothetical protein
VRAIGEGETTGWPGHEITLTYRCKIGAAAAALASWLRSKKLYLRTSSSWPWGFHPPEHQKSFLQAKESGVVAAEGAEAADVRKIFSIQFSVLNLNTEY